MNTQAKKQICYIFGAGEYFGDESVPANAFVIAADGGLMHCEALHITPDVIIGDFDSLGYEAQGESVIKLPKIKDDTDTMAAVRFGLEQGFRTFVFFGCTGGRLSHTVANLQTLTYLAKHGATGFLADKEEVATATCKGFSFNSDAQGFVSVFAAGSDVTLSESGLKYTLNRQTLTAAFPLGVSNEFIGAPARVEVFDGTALIIFEKRKGFADVL